MQTNPATIEITQPKLFTLGAVILVSAYGILLVLPLFFAILLVSLLKFGILTVAIPLVVVAATACFLPFGLGNTHITRLVTALIPAAGRGGDGFIVQLTLSPRIRSGLLAILEDADDIGYLRLASTGLVFQGDSVKLSVPYERIEKVQSQNIGLRGLFVYGRRIKVLVSGWPEVEWLEFAERSSWLLPASRRITRQLYERLLARIPPGAGEAAGQRTSP